MSLSLLMQEFSPLINYILRFVDLNEEELDYFRSFLKIKKLKKRQLLVQPGLVCNQKAM